MPIVAPMTWTELKDPLIDCYFCIDKKLLYIYPNLTLGQMRLHAHNETI